jgi:hypothetical protein
VKYVLLAQWFLKFQRMVMPSSIMVQHLKQALAFNFFTMKMMALQPFRMSNSLHPSAHYQISEDLIFTIPL